MTHYGVKFYKIENETETEIEMGDMPDEHINGLIEALRHEKASRDRLDRVYKGIGEGIMSKTR